MLDRADGADEHNGVRAELACAADDVHELFHAHVGTEARFGQDVVA